MRWQAQYFTDHAQRVKAILSEREVNAAALMSGDHVTMGMDKEVGEALTELRRSGREENAVTLCSRIAPRLGRHGFGSLEPHSAIDRGRHVSVVDPREALSLDRCPATYPDFQHLTRGGGSG